MKNLIKIALSTLILILLFSGMASADLSEKAQVIKENKDTNDLIIKRANGEKWLIQHTRECTSISTEFPVTLILNGDSITYVKVKFNEKCKVNYAVPYGGEGTFVRVIKSDNQMIADHVAEIIKDNKKYQIDYQKGCPYLYSYAGQPLYFQFSDNQDKGGDMIMQNSLGHCAFTFTKLLETLPSQDPTVPEALTGVMYEEQNNQVYLYWNPVTADGKWLYAISYSKFELDMSTYNSWKEMPNVKITNKNSYTVKNLANATKYYIYIAAVNEGKIGGPWSEITATPVAGESIQNNPDPEKFEIQMEEKTDSFRLYWPQRTDAKRYFVRLYVNGKLTFFKNLKPEQNEIVINKDPKYLGKGLRLEVKTIPLPREHALYDSIYWEYKE